MASNYVGQMLISGNVLTDNWGGVILWENADRNCSHRSDDACTLVDPSMYTLSSCGANLSEKSPVDNLDPADVAGSGSAQCTVANLCGFNGLFSNYGTRIYGDTHPWQSHSNHSNKFESNVCCHGSSSFFAWSRSNTANRVT